MSKWVLYSLLFIVMIIWGFNVVALKIIVTFFPAAMSQSVRVFLAGVVVIAILFFTKSLGKISRKNLKGIMVTAIFGVFAHHLCLALGLTMTTASKAGLILGLVPLSTSILAMFFLGEKLTIPRLIGILFALIGVYFIVVNGSNTLSGLSIGDIYIFGAVITQAISIILIKKLSADMDSRQMTGLMFLFGSTLLFVASLFIGQNDSNSFSGTPMYVWFVLLGSAVVATGLGHMLYNYAIHRLGAGSASIFTNLTPFFSLMGSALFLGERIVMEHIIGFIFIILGVILGTGTVEFYIRKRKKYKMGSKEVHSLL
ncbi:DMT family transporter [Bacillus sp. Marseille-P3661]|uniref:DMT family transporter n=1 Tax=Bacillus sp. Marseille-P3661 TaxID=1936234 RepID=UPI000C83E252|nr:DMT family transporter [Bacillus sp. Marseille-P3661]